MSIQQFKNLSSWREDILTIKGGEVFTLDFNDTTPNMFVVQNPNPVSLKISISSYPRTDSYEYKVDGNMTETMGRPISTNKIHILNDGSTDAVVRVYSINDTFDVQILKNMTVALNNATVETDGIIRGFSSGVSLPSGSNSIGNVGFNDTASVSIENILKYLNTLSSNSLSIKDNQIGTADNTRDLLQILNGSYTGTNIVNNILQYLKDNFSNIVMDDKNYSTFGSLFVKAVEKIVDAPSVINGDVNINKDYFWKENKEDIYSLRDINIKLKYADFDDSSTLYIDKNNLGNFYKTVENEETSYPITIINETDTTFDVFINIDDVQRAYSTVLKSDIITLENGVELIPCKLLNKMARQSLYFFRNMNAYIADCHVYVKVNVKNITGLLYDYKRVKTRKYSSTYYLSPSGTLTLVNDYSTKDNPIKIFDKIEKIITLNNSCRVKVYYTFSDYVEFNVTNTCGIENLDIPVYKIELSNFSTTDDVQCTVLGGLY